ncbi:MAG: hypothetical protein KatS3mg082_1406 [Nitrospiraceae bacterium]|nr:MAG: hypothetical protein KatS3mg082_1406 [Nitrospiraceae bacterium]
MRQGNRASRNGYLSGRSERGIRGHFVVTWHAYRVVTSPDTLPPTTSGDRRFQSCVFLNDVVVNEVLVGYAKGVFKLLLFFRC